MSELETIARQKIEISLEQRLTGLSAEIKAIQRELSAKGLLRSGAMLKRVLSACCSAVDSHAALVTSEYEWAVSQALLVSQSWVEGLVTEAAGCLDRLRVPVRGHLEQACKVADQPRLLDRLYNEFESNELAAKSRVALSLRTKFAERRRGLIRGLPRVVSRLISKLFRGGA